MDVLGHELEFERDVPDLSSAKRVPPRLMGLVQVILSWADRLGCALVLVVATPVMALSCLLVRLTSRGPVFYTQERVGLGGRGFTIYKIRSMYQNSEPNGAMWSGRGDRRVTPVGRVLRWTHLDELPQLINILLGDMALIGPRPERPEIVAKLEGLIPDYRRRLEARPGLTGLAQVLRGPDGDLASVQKKLELDLYYLKNRNLWMDVRIILATVPHVLRVPPRRIAAVFGFPKAFAAPLEGASEEFECLSFPVSASISEPCNAA